MPLMLQKKTGRDTAQQLGAGLMLCTGVPCPLARRVVQGIQTMGLWKVKWDEDSRSGRCHWADHSVDRRLPGGPPHVEAQPSHAAHVSPPGLAIGRGVDCSTGLPGPRRLPGQVWPCGISGMGVSYRSAGCDLPGTPAPCHKWPSQGLSERVHPLAHPTAPVSRQRKPGAHAACSTACSGVRVGRSRLRLCVVRANGFFTVPRTAHPPSLASNRHCRLLLSGA